MKKTYALVTLIVLVLAIVVIFVACTGTPTSDNDIDTGRVIQQNRRSIVVQEDDGERETHPLSRVSARKCSVGERYPMCLRS